MTYQEFVNAYDAKVRKMSGENSRAHALAILKKLYPDYVEFSQAESWGDHDLLLDTIVYCENLTMPITAPNDILKKIEQVSAIVPDTEDFQTILVSYALNASASLLEFLDYLLDGDSQHIFQIGSLYIDTVDFQVQELGAESEEEIDNHPQMIFARAYLLEEF